MSDGQRDLSFPFDGVPAPGEVTEVADGLFWLRMPLPFALDHINLWLLRDGTGWTIVDTGYALPEVRDHWREVLDRVVGDDPVHRVVVTHFHPDHVGLADWLCNELDAPLWMTAGEFFMAQWVFHDGGIGDFARQDRFFRDHGLPEEKLGPLTKRGNPYRRGVPALPGQFHRLREGDELTIGERRWRIIVGYGHAPEHASLYCAEDRLLISGDQVLPKITTNIGVWHTEPEGDPLGCYLDSFARFSGLDPATRVLPSHGQVFEGLHARLDGLREHHVERLERVVEACTGPVTAAELLGVLFRRELDLHQLRFAMGEAIAHLSHLWHQGVLVRETGSDGINRFSKP